MVCWVVVDVCTQLLIVFIFWGCCNYGIKQNLYEHRWDGGLEFQMIMMTHMVVLFILALSMENMLPKHLVQGKFID